uniref:Uncharacterized protein n=1 Tax=Arundo donax TaxID=35708 RepID=A0A0A8XTL1_ARUDO
MEWTPVVAFLLLEHRQQAKWTNILLVEASMILFSY